MESVFLIIGMSSYRVCQRILTCVAHKVCRSIVTWHWPVVQFGRGLVLGVARQNWVAERYVGYARLAMRKGRGGGGGGRDLEFVSKAKGAGY